MIKVCRSAPAPAVLLTDGVSARQRACEAVDSGRRPSFEDKICGHPDVRARLAADQQNKCCYCESTLDGGTIEHYRPKDRVRRDPGEAQASAGYYWLAYEWMNLYLACWTCNVSCKRDAFPLEEPARRICHHSDAAGIAHERPLLLDPGVDEPEQHIRFERQTPVALTTRGRRTIDLLRLDRAYLEGSREEKLAPLIGNLAILECARLGFEVPEEILEHACANVVRCSYPSAPYTAALRGVLRSRLGSEAVFPLTTAVLRAWARPVRASGSRP